MKTVVLTGLFLGIGCAGAPAGEIHQAARSGDVESLRTLIKADEAIVNAADGSGFFPLHLAVMHEQPNAVETLLAHRAAANAEDADGYTPLRWAILRGRADLLKRLLERGANPNLRNKQGYAAMHWAVLQERREIVEILLSANANVNARDRSGYTPLHYTQDPELIALLRRHGARETPRRDPSHASEDFLHAIATGNEEKVKAFLLTNPALADAMQDGINRWTVLHEAATEGRVSIVAILLEQDANPDVANAKGETPLHWAARKGHAEIVQLLLSRHADVNARDEKNRTPLHEAANRGHKQVVELLIAAKADPSARDEKGKAPLFYALDNGHAEIAELLRKHGARD